MDEPSPLACVAHNIFAETPVQLTLMLQTHAEEKRVRVRQMWVRAGSDRMNSTSPYVRSCPRRARLQMARYHASAAIFTGLGMQH